MKKAVKEVDIIERVKKLLSKKYDSSCFKKLSDLEDAPFISSGSLRLDIVLKRPFSPGVHMVYGTYGAGKTTLCLEALAKAQQSSYYDLCVYENLERRINKSLVATIDQLEGGGVMMANPDTAEQAGDLLADLLRSLGKGEHLFGVVDSVAAMEPEVIAQKSLGEQRMGIDPKIIGEMVRKVNRLAADTGSTIIFINQTRENVGVRYGPKLKVPGGNALWFYSTQVIALSQSSSAPYGKRTTTDGNMFGRVVKATVEKNSWAKPYVSVPLSIYFGKGVDRSHEAAQLLIEAGIAEQSGTWITVETQKDINEEIKVQGLENLGDMLRENPEQLQKFTDQLMKMHSV